MEFPKTTKEEDKIAFDEGLRIFGELRKRYSNESIRDLDIVLNSLCTALVRLTILNVTPKDYESFVDLIHAIILGNLKRERD